MLGPCRNHPDEIGILELESEKRRKDQRGAPGGAPFLCAREERPC